MDTKAIKALEAILKRGDTAEVKPGPNGTVKIIHIKRAVALDTGK